jgi:uncharacterized protein (TIGR03663 family)
VRSSASAVRDWFAPAILGSAIPSALSCAGGSVRRALTAAAALCLSPAYLYYSRFAREDIYVAFFSLLLVVLVFRFLERPTRWLPAAITAVLAVNFATKETTYILVFVGGTFFIAATAFQVQRARRRDLGLRSAPIVAAISSAGRDAWIWALAAFALVYTILFTSFLFEPQGLRTGLYESIHYWLSQQPVNRGGQPWFYYLLVVPAYELPILLLAAIGAVAALRQPTVFRLFLVWDAVLSLAVYSWASERMPWLTLHVLLPLVLLAGIGAQALWELRPSKPVAAVLGAAGAAFLVFGGVNVAYAHPADPAELLVFTQTSTEALPIRDEILSANRSITTDVDSWGGTGWPWAWYLRDAPVGYPDMSDADYVPKADVVAVTDVNRERLVGKLSGYRGRRFHLREWWVVDWAGATPSSVWRWFLRREAWSVKGTLDEWLYVRDDSPAAVDAGHPDASAPCRDTAAENQREHEERQGVERVQHERERHGLESEIPYAARGDGRRLEHSQSCRRRGSTIPSPTAITTSRPAP